MHLSIRSRLSALAHEGGLGATALAAGLALALSLSMSSYLNRDLLDEVNAATALMERQQAVVASHDAVIATLLELARPSPVDGGADRAALDRREREAQLGRQVSRMKATLGEVPAVAGSATYREVLVSLGRLAASDTSAVAEAEASSSPRPSGLDAVSASHAAAALEPMNRLGHVLRLHADAERLAQQASMVRLRTHTVGITHLMCLLFSVTVALATHGVLSARREARSRAAADAARLEAEAAGRRATEAGRDKSKFLGMLSHELLTPLQSIVSSMDIIESRGRVDIGDPLFMRLREGTRSLRARMSDLVDFARMSAGRLAVSPRRFRIDRLIEEVLADHEEALLRKDLDVHWEPAAELRQPIVTDPRRVRQILDNLVSNAIKYTERGGLTVSAQVDAGASLVLDVRDTGVGMSRDALAQIFDPFYRVGETAQLADGSGLGLAVVRSLVDLLDGTLEVESVPGEGSRFSVRLPLVRREASPSDALPAPDAGGREVLIVDDAHDVRALVAEVVRSCGFVPSEAGSAGEALRWLDERPFAAVLMDLQLPDLPGDEVARRVRAGDGPNRTTRLVMLSASGEAEVFGSAHFDARIDKPVARAQLRSVLSDLAAPPAG